MEKNGPYFIVGLFVMLGLAGLIGFALWLGGSIDTRNYERYAIHFTDPVNGLKEGASVQYRGVDVGKVTKVGLSKKQRNVIRVEIQIDPSVPVGAGTVAQLEVFGITGLVYISLSTDPKDDTIPHKIEGEDYPVIEGRGTQLSKLLSDIPTITRKIADTSERVNRVFSDDNITRLDQAIANIENLSRDMNGLLSAENIATAGTALHSTATAMESLNALGQKSQEMVTRLTRTADNIDEAAAALNALVRTNGPHLSRFSQQGLRDIESTSKAARRMADSIRTTVDKIGDDPSQLLAPPAHGGTVIPH